MHFKKLDDESLAFWVPALTSCFILIAILVMVMVQGKAFMNRYSLSQANVIETAQPVLEPSVAVTPVVHQDTTPVLVRYTVKNGDTLLAIAKEFCVDYLALARENDIKNPNRIYAGKTVLSVKNGCARNTPPVLVKQSVSPGEFARNGGASREKHISSQPEGSSLQSPDTSSPASAVTDRPISEMYHREIYRIVDLGKRGKGRTTAESAELTTLRQAIRTAVFNRYGHLLKNVDCLYDGKLKIAEQVLCIRENYGDRLTEAAKDHDVSRDHLEALILIESRGQPDAISSEGCAGVKQFCLRTSRGYGLADRFDPVASIDRGAKHLADNLDMWHGDMAKALLHYGAGIAAAKSANAENAPYVRAIAQVVKVIRRMES